jgi:hypothetical protein
MTSSLASSGSSPPGRSSAPLPDRTYVAVVRPGRQEEDEAIDVGLARPRGRLEQRLGGRDPGDRHVELVGEGLGRREADPQPG